MKGNGYQIILVVVLLNFNIYGVVTEDDESNDEVRPNYEYIQIFNSIPALFEYLLDVLEERPEILEKNDVTLFKRTIDSGETEDSDSSDSEKKIDKRDAGDNPNEHDDTNKVSKRDTSTSTTADVPETTVAYEYGNSNVVMKSLDRVEGNQVIFKSFANTDNFNKFYHKAGVSMLSKLDGNIDELYRYGEMFLGFEHLFGLDLKPEEIEERILTAEKLLEEHNNKKEEK